MDATVQAFNMLAQGKRNLICGEVPTAVTQFQEACKLLYVHHMLHGFFLITQQLDPDHLQKTIPLLNILISNY